MKEFVVNSFIILRLEEGQTNIYVDDKYFTQCKFLLLDIPVNEIREFDNIESIDEAAERLDRSLEVHENDNFDIPPKTEFWGHCSNLQVWAENEYNTKLLHSNLAFPLLKRLTEVGDPIANRTFREEIAKRFKNGNPSVITYLDREGYLEYLSNEELTSIFEGFDYTKITNLNYKVKFPLLTKLIRLKVPLIMRVFKEQVINQFKSGKLSDLIYLNDEGYLKYLSKEELILIFEGFDFTKITNLDYKDSFPLLTKLIRLEVPLIMCVFKEQIVNWFKNGNPSVITYLNDRGFLKYLNKEELTVIFEEFDFSNITNLDYGDTFPLLRKLIRLEVPLIIRVFKEEVVKRFKSGNPSVMTYLNEEGYLKYLNKEEIATIFEGFNFSKITNLEYTVAFPLLDNLAQTSNPIANKIFKEEIVKNFKSGNPSVINYLNMEGYLEYLNKAEITSIFEGFGIETLTRLKFKKVEKMKYGTNWVFTVKNQDLTGVGLSKRSLPFLPESIGNLKSLKKLILDDNKLTRLPKSIGNLKSLEILILEHNQLISLPESIGELTSLKILDLRYNEFTTLPESLGELTSLELLLLDGNMITTLPESLGNLKSLERLELKYTKLTSLPKSIGNLTSLKRLILEYNQVTTLPESIGNLTSLERLELNNNKLTTLPKSIGNLTSLERLILDNNQLTSLPKSIGKLTSLNTLALRSNKLKILPKSIGNLRSLAYLGAPDNILSKLPETIGNFTLLKELWLGGNKLKRIPRSIGKLKLLGELDLESNELSNLPESMANLKSLFGLSLRKNKFTRLPESITNIKSLQILYLDHNQLTSLPESVANLNLLGELRLEKNPLDKDSKTLIKQLKKTLKYLKITFE